MVSEKSCRDRWSKNSEKQVRSTGIQFPIQDQNYPYHKQVENGAETKLFNLFWLYLKLCC